MKKRFCVLALSPLFTVGGFAVDAGPAQNPSEVMVSACPTPWFTGPLITPSGHVVPKGYVNIEPYVFYTTTTGDYDNEWNLRSVPTLTRARFSVPIYIGITPDADVLFIPTASWSNRQGASTLRYNDFPVEIDYQLLHDTENNRLPGIKLYVQELFPIGQFEKLDPEKFGTDRGGHGTFDTAFGGIITRLFELKQCHWLSLRFNAFVTIPSNVHVRGLNAYGGAPDTDAKIKPGIRLDGQFGMEYTFTRNWVFATDLLLHYEDRICFSGFPGTLPDGSLAPLGQPPSLQFSIAPGIEYNFNEAVGIIAGGWFSFAGRNAPHFLSAVIAINYFGPQKKGKKHAFRFGGGAGAAGGGGGGGGG